MLQVNNLVHKFLSICASISVQCLHEITELQSINIFHTDNTAIYALPKFHQCALPLIHEGALFLQTLINSGVFIFTSIMEAKLAPQ